MTGRPARLFLCPLLLGLVLLLGACAAPRMPPGPGPSEPRLTADSVITKDGTELPLRTWLPAGQAPRAVVLALHGFNDYSNAFEAPGTWLCQQGIAVYAYDQRGFGEAPHTGLWAGSEQLAEDLATTAALLARRHPGVPLYLLGESMGGAVVVAAMTGPAPPAVDGVILSAPAVWSRETMPFYQRGALWLAARVIPWAKFTGEGLGVQASDNIEMLRGLGRDPLFIKGTRVVAVDGLTDLMGEALEGGAALHTPALVLYGEKDQVVPADPTLRFWRSLPPDARRLVLYEEGWHLLLRDLQAAVVLTDIEAWIADPAAPLPSGADLQASEDLATLVGGAT
ncbi:MAG: lysophospholipase [Pseudomonadota bacterium]